jgi:hypothetical protein
MSLDLTAQITSLVTFLNDNNTTTSSNYISSSLSSSKVKTVYKGVSGMHQSFPVPATMYPCIFVELVSKTEEFRELGRSARRWVDITYDIIPITNYGMGQVGIDRTVSDVEIIQLTQNIEALIRANITLSSTVDITEIKKTDYSVKISNDTYNAVSRIRLSCKKLTT